MYRGTKIIDLRVGFLIAFCGMLLVYMPIIGGLFESLLYTIEFWDRLKTLPNVIQMLLFVSMFVGAGLIVNTLKDLIKSMVDMLFGRDEY
jgi:hypothetical protein